MNRLISELLDHAESRSARSASRSRHKRPVPFRETPADMQTEAGTRASPILEDRWNGAKTRSFSAGAMPTPMSC